MREEGPTNVATSRAGEGSYRNLEGIIAAYGVILKLGLTSCSGFWNSCRSSQNLEAQVNPTQGSELMNQQVEGGRKSSNDECGSEGGGVRSTPAPCCSPPPSLILQLDIDGRRLRSRGKRTLSMRAAATVTRVTSPCNISTASAAPFMFRPICHQPTSFRGVAPGLSNEA